MFLTSVAFLYNCRRHTSDMTFIQVLHFVGKVKFTTKPNVLSSIPISDSEESECDSVVSPLENSDQLQFVKYYEVNSSEYLEYTVLQPLPSCAKPMDPPAHLYDHWIREEGIFCPTF